MLRKFMTSFGLGIFALSGCEDYGLIAEPPGEMRVVHVDGQPDHCIVADPANATPAPSSPRSIRELGVAEGR